MQGEIHFLCSIFLTFCSSTSGYTVYLTMCQLKVSLYSHLFPTSYGKEQIQLWLSSSLNLHVLAVVGSLLWYTEIHFSVVLRFMG